MARRGNISMGCVQMGCAGPGSARCAEYGCQHDCHQPLTERIKPKRVIKGRKGPIPVIEHGYIVNWFGGFREPTIKIIEVLKRTATEVTVVRSPWTIYQALFTTDDYEASFASTPDEAIFRWRNELELRARSHEFQARGLRDQATLTPKLEESL